MSAVGLPTSEVCQRHHMVRAAHNVMAQLLANCVGQQVSTQSMHLMQRLCSVLGVAWSAAMIDFGLPSPV